MEKKIPVYIKSNGRMKAFGYEGFLTPAIVTLTKLQYEMLQLQGVDCEVLPLDDPRVKRIKKPTSRNINTDEVEIEVPRETNKTVISKKKETVVEPTTVSEKL